MGQIISIKFYISKKDTCNVLNVQNKLPTMTRLYYICFFPAQSRYFINFEFEQDCLIECSLQINKTIQFKKVLYFFKIKILTAESSSHWI